MKGSGANKSSLYKSINDDLITNKHTYYFILQVKLFIFQLECCGAYLNKPYNSWRDALDSPYPIGAVLVPESCCLQFEESERHECQRNPTESKFNVAGCFDKLETTFEKNRTVFLAIGLTILITMVIVLQRIVIWTRYNNRMSCKQYFVK